MNCFLCFPSSRPMTYYSFHLFLLNYCINQSSFSAPRPYCNLLCSLLHKSHRLPSLDINVPLLPVVHRTKWKLPSMMSNSFQVLALIYCSNFINLEDKWRAQVLRHVVPSPDLATLPLRIYHLLCKVFFDTPHWNLVTPFSSVLSQHRRFVSRPNDCVALRFCWHVCLHLLD